MRISSPGGLLVILALFGASRPAQATTIDFTNRAIWGGANGQSSFAAVIDGITVTVTGLSGLLTFNSGDVNSGCVTGTGGLACQGDGLGVVDDEVTAGTTEKLEVTFSSPVSVTALGLLDLFGFPNKSGDIKAEVAKWTVYYDSAPSQSGSVTGTDTTTTLGYKAVAVNYTDVSRIRFYADVPVNSDFALASIGLAVPVPEPATLLMSSLGLLGASMLRWGRGSRIGRKKSTRSLTCFRVQRTI